MTPGAEHSAWVADPAIAWRIVLGAELTAPLEVTAVRRRLERLHREQGWLGTGSVTVAADLADLRRRLGEERSGVVSVGLSPDGREVVVAAHHSRVDGLGLLAVLATVSGTAVSSSARGVGDRPDRYGAAGTVIRRLAEVVGAPPARIRVPAPTATPRPPAPAPGDVYVECAVPGEVRTAALVVAAARGVDAHNRGHGASGPTRHIAVAVGVTRDAATWPIADRSALLRLRDVERLDPDAVAAALREEPTQRTVGASGGPGGAGGAAGRGAGLMRLGLRALGPRLGSTLLVSHLGRVRADGIARLTFHPVTAGGSGVSLGAVTYDEARPTTRLGLRARGTTWTHDGLEQVLEAVVSQLG